MTHICNISLLSIKTNHRLRATGATCLFNAGVPENIIQKTTGHSSIEALRGYESVYGPTPSKYQSTNKH